MYIFAFDTMKSVDTSWGCDSHDLEKEGDMYGHKLLAREAQRAPVFTGVKSGMAKTTSLTVGMFLSLVLRLVI